MEPLAENRFTITKELFYEGTLRVTRESFGPFARKALAALAALWVILAAVTLATRGSVIFALVELGVVILVGVWLCVFFPRSRARRAWNALENRCGTDLERVTRFYDGFLEIDSGGETTTVFYKDVAQILLSEHLLILTSRDRAGVLVERNSFVTGSAAMAQGLVERGMGRS